MAPGVVRSAVVNAPSGGGKSGRLRRAGRGPRNEAVRARGRRRQAGSEGGEVVEPFAGVQDDEPGFVVDAGLRIGRGRRSRRCCRGWTCGRCWVGLFPAWLSSAIVCDRGGRTLGEAPRLEAAGAGGSWLGHEQRWSWRRGLRGRNEFYVLVRQGVLVKARRRRRSHGVQASLGRFACGGRFTEGGAVQRRVGSILSSSWVPSEVARLWVLSSLASRPPW